MIVGNKYDMEYRKLGNSDINVSVVSLGTMTFGEQCSKDDAFSLIHHSINAGINLIDTAEMYPIYPKRETSGLSESIIGDYISKYKNRAKVVIATKIASCHPEGIGATGLPWIRGGGKTLRFNEENIEKAIDSSLRRLKTEYIDLYQLHWPERSVSITSKLDFECDPDEEIWTGFYEILQIMNEYVKKGKIRYFGISNETPWGFTKLIDTADRYGFPRPVSIQNSYSLINRVFDIGTSEVSIREGCGLLAYAPLAGGRLSGKYINGNRPENSRYTMWPGKNSMHHSEKINNAVINYQRLANEYGVQLTKMAIAFVISRPFVSSVILGAKSLSQLQESIDSVNVILPKALVEEINKIHRSCPNPIFQ